MTLRSNLRLYQRQVYEDSRGCLTKVITGAETGLESGIRDIYVVSARPGETRGNHYHRRAREWFTVLEGSAGIALEDPRSGEQLLVILNGEFPTTLEVPPGVAHAIKALGDASLSLIAAADAPYSPDDTVAYEIVLRASADDNALEINIDASPTDDVSPATPPSQTDDASQTGEDHS